MKVFLLRFDDSKTVRVYSNKDKLLKDYYEISKNYYDDFPKVVRNIVFELKKFYPEMSNENKQDLINFIQGEEYKGIFTLEELESVSIFFQLTELTLV